VRPGVAPEQRVQRIDARVEKDFGQPDRQHRAEGVAVTARIFGGDPAGLARDPRRHRTPLVLQKLQPLLGHAAIARLFVGEVAKAREQVVRIIGVAWEALGQQALELELDRGDCLWVEQLA
jgi:hypothetical protein